MLPKYVHEDAMNMQKQYMEDDPKIGLIGAYLSTRGGLRSSPYVSAKEIAVEALKWSPDKNFGMRDIHNIMLAEFPEWVPVGKQRCGEYGVQRAYMKENLS
jgi:hypothetical protein